MINTFVFSFAKNAVVGIYAGVWKLFCKMSIVLMNTNEIDVEDISFLLGYVFILSEEVDLFIVLCSYKKIKSITLGHWNNFVEIDFGDLL